VYGVCGVFILYVCGVVCGVFILYECSVCMGVVYG